MTFKDFFKIFWKNISFLSATPISARLLYLALGFSIISFVSFTKFSLWKTAASWLPVIIKIQFIFYLAYKMLHSLENCTTVSVGFLGIFLNFTTSINSIKVIGSVFRQKKFLRTILLSALIIMFLLINFTYLILFFNKKRSAYYIKYYTRIIFTMYRMILKI